MTNEATNQEKQPYIVLGFDFGMKRIGTAVGQTLTRSATPLKTLNAKEGIPDWNEIAGLIQMWHPHILIVGLPFHMDGSEQAITKAARQFGQTLVDRFSLPVHSIDERLSSVDARARLYADGGYRGIRKGDIDSFAAQVIVETWMTEHLSLS